MTAPSAARTFSTVGVTLALAACALPARAIVTRHDVDAVATSDEARRFAAVCKILPDGEGVLIAPEWILTAGHVAAGAPVDRLRVRVGGIDHTVAAAFPYPDRGPGRGDIGLLRLAEPARGVEPLALGGAELAPGDIVHLAGRGDFGDGRRGVVGNDGKLRVAENAVDEVEPGRFSVRLDPPGEGALPAEGVSGPGDSGTPALVPLAREDGADRLAVAGIGSAGISPEGERYGKYGSRDVFVAVAAYRDWIDRTMRGDGARDG